MTRRQSLSLFTSGLLIFSILSVSPVWAHDDSNESSKSGNTHVETHQSVKEHHQSSIKVESVEEKVSHIKNSIASKAAELKTHVEENKEEHHAKLDATKLKFCQNRKTAITNRTHTTVTFAQRAEEAFSSIATKVETFKTTKNLNVDNYDALVSDVNAKRAATDAAIAKATASRAAFDCNSADPKGQIATFKTDLQAVRQALKEYRTSIKTLTKAVRAAHGLQASGSAQPL